MVGPNLNLNVDVNKCFSRLWKCRRRHKTAGIKIGPFGGTGTHNFDIGGSASRITRVKLRTGSVVNSLQFFYDIDRRNVETDRLGGEGGELRTIDLQPDEYINSMSGRVCEYKNEICISRLEFNTNLGSQHGPFGRLDGRRFSVPVMNGRIVGFFGRYTKCLNEIGVSLVPN